MREAASLQGSPSTCTGMALDVVSSTSRHCVSLSPCPPTCSAACGHRRLRSGASGGVEGPQALPFPGMLWLENKLRVTPPTESRGRLRPQPEEGGEDELSHPGQ